MDSFLNSSLGVDTSKTNYLKTAPDLTKAVNEQIDENIKMMNNHFDSLIKMQQQSRKANREGWKEIAAFTKEGMKFAAWARDKADAKNAINNYYDRSLNKVKSRAKREAELDVNEAELDAQKRVNYTAAGEIEAFDPELANALKQTGLNRAQIKELLSLAVGQSGEFFERARSQIQAEVAPGVWKSWDEPGGLTALERSIISKEIDEVFITQLVNSGINDRLIEKYVLKPMLNQHNARLVTAQAESLKAEKEQQIEFRNKEFANNFNLLAEAYNGGGGEAIEKYLQDYNGYHSTSSGLKDKGYFLARQELQGFILDGIQNGLIDPDSAEAAITQYKLSPNDGGKPRSVEEYLPEFAAPIKKAITKARSDKYNQAKLELQNRQNAWVQPVLEEWRKNTPTEEVVQEMNQKYRAEFGENHPDLLNFWSKQDIADADIEMELNERWSKTGEIFIEDLDGISDGDIKAKWLQRVTQGGLSSKEITKRDATIKTIVNDRTLERDANRDKSFKWDTIYNNALERYDEIYRSERSQGQNHRTAKSIALKETKAYIESDASEIKNWELRDENKADNINSARAAVIKDNSVIDSPDLWKGEEAELKAALRYVKTGKGTLPQYYRSFPNINLTAHELMQRRLVATGMLKSSEVEPIPERKLDPVQQDLLLNKPSAARTYRAFENMSIEEIDAFLEYTDSDSSEELISASRANAERNNQLSGYEISQVNIDPALEEEHTQVVGEQSTFMRLNTMLPGVATAYVEDTYNV